MALAAFPVRLQRSMRILVNFMTVDSAAGPSLDRHLCLAFAAFCCRQPHTPSSISAWNSMCHSLTSFTSRGVVLCSFAPFRVWSAIWHWSYCQKVRNLSSAKADRSKLFKFLKKWIDGIMAENRPSRWASPKFTKKKLKSRIACVNRSRNRVVLRGWKACGHKQHCFSSHHYWQRRCWRAQYSSAFSLPATVFTCGSPKFWIDWVTIWMISQAYESQYAKSFRIQEAWIGRKQLNR